MSKVSALVRQFDGNPKGNLAKVNSLLGKEIGQFTIDQTRLMAAGKPGALVSLDLSQPGAKPIMVVGDLHGNEDNLNELLGVYGAALDRGEIKLVFLGDILHPERGDLREMASSFRLLKSVIMLKIIYPKQVHFILGNHDQIYTSQAALNVALEAHQADPKIDAYAVAAKYAHYPLVDSEGVDRNMFLTKTGGKPPLSVYQAIEFLLYLIGWLKGHQLTEAQIKQTLALYQGFFDGCPLAVQWRGSAGNGLMAHTAAVRGGVATDGLINARSNHNLINQLTWNRYLDGDKTISYTEADAVQTAVKTGLWNEQDPEYQTTLVSGHSPNRDGVTPIYLVYDPKLRVPAHYQNIFSLVVHGNMSNFAVLKVKVDGTIDG